MASFPEKRAPMVGRDDELEFLLMRVAQALKGHGRTVMVAGDAGIGKTRLCEELESRAMKAGCTVMVGRCLPGATAAFLPFHDAARSLRLHGLGEMAEEGPSEGRDMEDVFGSCANDDSSRFTNERIVLNFLTSIQGLTAKAPLLLRLEDLHWMDSASSLMLQMLARAVGKMRVLVLATYRPEDLVREGRPHPLMEALEQMRKDGTIEELSLRPLDPMELKQGMEGMLGSSVDPELARTVWQDSSGNPLFAFEMVRLLLREKHLALIDGSWMHIGGREEGVPATMRDVLLRRVDRLAPEHRRLLDHASVMGLRFHSQVLAQVLLLPMEEVRRELDAIRQEHGLVQVYQGEDYFAHETVRRVVYAELGDRRRREYHLAVGEAIEAHPPLEDRYGELSLHFREGKVAAKCAEYSLKAGDCCLRRYALTEALAFYQAALATLPPEEPGPRRARALEGSGDALFEMREYEGAYARFDAAMAILVRPRDRGRLLRKSGECWWPTRLGHGSKETMLQLFDEAEAQPDLDPYDRAEVLSNRAVFAAWEGDFGKADAYCCEAEAILEGLRSCERLGLELVNHLGVALSQGDAPRAKGISLQIGRIYSRYPSLRGELEAVMSEAICLRHEGSRSAFTSYRRALDMCSRLGDHVEACWSLVLMAELHHLYGEGEAALREAREAVAEARRSGSAYMMAVSSAIMACCHAHLGQAARAEERMQDARRFGSVAEWKIRTTMHYYLNLGQAEALAAARDWEGSAPYYENAISIASGNVYGVMRESMARLWYGRSLLAMGRVEEARGQLHRAAETSATLGNRRAVEEAQRLMR